MGKTTFAIKRNDIHFFSIVFSSCCEGKQLQKGFVFLPQNGLQLRLEDLFSSPDFAAVLEEKSAEWRQEQGVSSNLPTLQDFYLTQDELVLLFPLLIRSQHFLSLPFGGSEWYSVRISAFLPILNQQKSS